LGGQALRGTFRIKRASKNIFPEILASGGGDWGLGEVISKKISGHTKKNFPDIPHFFVNMKKIFLIYQKNFRIYDIFPGNENNFPEIT
jgi:hypothetical protein